MRPEKALRLLDTLDGMAYAVRLVSAGYWGRRIGFALVTIGILGGLALARLF